ncbi:pentatricopeptide repeat-containing protein [Perkinsela sp. CCAP 1560/4]|nr:pentatricopeptide repeat-containing protein [Perkinsela sp. CCAP 1560/4]|eukprot:KNH07400.1 pentatricopeptide repeat-containing protein [Perkinsela sp. CCAP 1560/4]
MSNYAKALKHIALRGRAGVGLSAAEAEIKLYKKSFLPPDYAPPKIDKWDDMIQRWTYAWQYPVSDTIETPSRQVLKDYRNNLIELADFLKSVAENPPFLKTENDKCYPLLPKIPQHERLPPSDHISSTEVSSKASNAEEAPFFELVPGEPMVEEGIPLAYVDVMAPITVFSKELAIHLADVGLSFDEDGIKTAIRALGLADKESEATFLFDFARSIGLAGRNIISYNALASNLRGKDCVKSVMELIERAKSNGITPNIVTWNILISRMSNVGDTQGAIQVYSHMKALANIEPNEEVITTMLWVYASDNSEESTQKCIELFEQMQSMHNMVPLRASYVAVLFSLRFRKSRLSELLELAQKMEIVGYHWSPLVYECLMINHSCTGNLTEIRSLHAKMRENGVEMTAGHLFPIIEALRNQSDQDITDKLKFWRSQIDIGWGVLRLIQKRCAHLEKVQYQVRVEVGFDALLRLLETGIEKISAHYPGEWEKLMPVKQEATKIYEKGPYEDGITPWSKRCHVNYMKVLAHFPEDRARVTSLFHVVLGECRVAQNRSSKNKLYRACVVMIKMHLKSGEEGGTRKALEYIELMENHSIFPSRHLMRQIRRIADEAAYTRDMKRRARRMQQAKEEYNEKDSGQNTVENPSHTEVNVETSNTAFDPINPLSPQDISSLKDQIATQKDEYSKSQIDEYFLNPKKNYDNPNDLPPLGPVQPLGDTKRSASFWDSWSENTISKHEMFEDNAVDNIPQGGIFSEKNTALQKLGIISKFENKEDIPNPAGNKLLQKLRGDGTEPAGALWAIDGSGYSYPSSRSGVFGWDATFWRERQIIKKAYDQSISSGNLSWIRNVPASLPNLSKRTVPEQLELEQTGAKSDGELADSRAYPLERYDSGEHKLPSEHASPVTPKDAYAWEKEKDHPLIPYMTEKEIIQEMGYDDEIDEVESEDTLGVITKLQSERMNERTMETLRNAPTDVISYGATHGMGEHKVTGYKNRKYDYLRRFKEMYQRGQLEVPDEPIVRFGRKESDLTASTAASVEAFYAAHEKAEKMGEARNVTPISANSVMKRNMRRGNVTLRTKKLRTKGVRRKSLGLEKAHVEPHD